MRPCFHAYFANDSSSLTIAAKIESIVKKNTPSMSVMIITITPVMIVSRRVGQTTFLVSVCT